MNAIEVHNLTKVYKLYESSKDRLKEILSFDKRRYHQDFFSLNGVSFQVKKGESVGIIGQNGSGKSTLLQLICGVLRPSSGHVYINGRIAALLELGAAFNPEFTGRDNVYINGALMGFSRTEMDRYFPEIAAFAEIGVFIDQPVKTYSSGMFVRLAFSLAVNLIPDILIVDEALSVGDAYFQHKCFAKIREFQQRGSTLLFVSHDFGAIKTLCDRSLLLDEGKLIKDGAPDNVFDYYNALIAKKENDAEIKQIELQRGRTITRSGSGEAQIISVEMTDESDKPSSSLLSGSKVKIICRINFRAKISRPCVGFLIRDRLGNDIFGVNTELIKPIDQDFDMKEQMVITFELPLRLGAGSYSLSVAVVQGRSHLNKNYDWLDQALVFQILPIDESIGSAWLPATYKFFKEDLQ